MEDEQALSIGAVEGAEHEMFGRIRRVALASDTVISVSESWVEEDGSIGVIDLALRRVTRYHGDGGFDLPDHPVGPAMPWYMTRDGRFVRLPGILSPIPRVDINRGVGGVLDPANARVLIRRGSGRWEEGSLPPRCPPVPEEFFEDSAEGAALSADIPRSGFREVAPIRRPAHDHLAASGDALIWVRPTRDGGENEAVERWYVMDPGGKPMRGVILPARFTPMELQEGVVYGRWLDSLEVNYAKAFRLSSPWEP